MKSRIVRDAVDGMPSIVLEAVTQADWEVAEAAVRELDTAQVVIDKLYDGVAGLDDPTTLARLRNFFDEENGSGYHHVG